MIFIKILSLLLLVVEITGRTTLTAESGQISEYSGGAVNSYRIKASKGRKIILSVTNLRLGNGFLKMRDGRNGDEEVYTMVGSTVYKSVNGRKYRVGTDEISMTTEAAKLFITEYVQDDGEGFSATYASYSKYGCYKDELDDTFADSEKTCDTAELAPMASSCEVTLVCNDNYVQYNKKMICNTDGEWNGDVQCLPKKEMISQCSFDFDELTDNDDCLFTADEVAKYLIDIENADVFESSLSRSSGKRWIDCGDTCAHNRYGRWAVRCPTRPTWYNRRTYALCVMCRTIHHCNGRVIAF